MSDRAIIATAESEAGETALPPARSLTRRVLGDTFVRWGARFGMVWVGVLTFAAVFAPLLANSHPLLMNSGGQWSSPAMRHLTPADVSLLAAALFVGVLYCLRRIRPRTRVIIFAVTMALVIAAAVLWVKPPKNIIYDQYREKQHEIDIAFYAPIPFSPTDHLRDMPELRLKPPSLAHPMGIEADGADVLSSMLHACRIAMAIGFIATGIAMVLGTILGGLMGYFSKAVDLIGMRLVEMVEAIPTLLLLITFVAFFKVNLYLMMAIIGFTSWTGYARYVRAEFLKLRQQDFIQAARACGLPIWSILFRHMLPNGLAPVLVSASFGIASAILYESTLSFLGLGEVEEASWGKLLEQARGLGGTFYWWMMIYPGGAIFLTVLAYNLIGEAMRDAIDPHTNRPQQA